MLIGHWNAGDRDPVLLGKYLDPAVRLESPLASVSGSAYEGHSGIVRWMHDLDDQFSEWTVGVNEIRQARREVIAITTVSARGRTSAAPLQFSAATTFGFASDDRVARISIYLDVQEAFKAAGLAE
jgi:hypothetical protein